ncbi:uncharacterized protein LOC141713928 [Apium graveolens]|uniref:uncharacterized protein LOC141713928 n=1 Tax=Apium graveolens TaxID=4045 RepID=UPI003D7992DF
MDDLHNIPDIEKGSDLYFFVVSMFEHKAKKNSGNTWKQQMLKLIDMNCLTIHNSDDEADDKDDFWDLVNCTIALIVEYYCTFLHKEPCMTFYQTGHKWMQEILTMNEIRCKNMFRMEKETFFKLCTDLENVYHLPSSRRMTFMEKVGIFIFIIAQGASNRHAQERFQHSGETVSHVFHEVLHAVCLLARDLIKPDDPEFKEIPPHIRNDRRYKPHFKDCIGAIDGTHIHACVPVND